MSSSKAYLDFIMEQLSELDDLTYRAMMGEYIIYYRGKIIGGIYDNCFLLKPEKSALSRISNVIMKTPYDGAKEMILVDNLDDKDFICGLVKAMYDELPVSVKKRKK